MAKKMTGQELFYYGKGYAQGKIDFAKQELSYYDKGYAQGKIDFAKEVMERIGCIETCYGDDYDMGVDWAVCEALKIINEMVGGSDE